MNRGRRVGAGTKVISDDGLSELSGGNASPAWMVVLNNKKEYLAKAVKECKREKEKTVRKKKEKHLPEITQIGPHFSRVSRVELARLTGADVKIEPGCFVSTCDDRVIIFKPNIDFGGMRDGNIFFIDVDEEKAEVAFFPVVDVVEVTKTSKYG